MFEVETVSSLNQQAPIPKPDLDRILTTQFVVAWAGEAGEEKRMGWWRSDLISEFGGEDLFKRLLPSTWEWAVLESTRKAAQRADAELRKRDHNPDRILSLYRFGFKIDEQLDERLQELKQSRNLPKELLSGLAEGINLPWNQPHFGEWLSGHGTIETVASPIGRRLKGKPPSSLDMRMNMLVAGLLPLENSYPLPHFRID